MGHRIIYKCTCGRIVLNPFELGIPVVRPKCECGKPMFTAKEFEDRCMEEECCDNCLHSSLEFTEEPCVDCYGGNWEESDNDFTDF